MAAEDAAVTVSLRANLKDYEAALKAAVRQTERAAKAAEDAVSGIGKRANFKVIQGGAQQTGKSLNAMQNDVRNLGFQFNDLATQIAAGTSPLQAIAQQGGQIAQTFAGVGGAMGALRLVMGALLNPITLITVGIGIATTAFAAFFAGSEEGAKEATKALDEQLAAVNRLREAKGLEAVGKPRDALELFIAEREVLKTQVEIMGQLGAKVAEVRRLFAGTGRAKAAFEGDRETIEAISGALGLLEEQMRAGRPDLEAFARAMADLERRGNLPENVKALSRNWSISRHKALCRRAISTNCEKP